MANDFRKIQIALIVYDFDGVMTDNRVLVFQDGSEAVIVNRADGLGINMIKSLGIPQLIISTETNSVVSARAAKVGLPVIQGVEDKKKALIEYCNQHGYDLQKTLYLGNDMNDFEVMKIVGFPVAPSNAHEDIKKVASLVINTGGGEGVVRELADYLIE